jgi:CRISPR-associated protein Cas2
MYDISGPAPLRKTHKLLCAWGVPVQYSVFRVRGSRRQINQLHHELLRIVSSDDRLLIIRVCDTCVKTAIVEGRDLAPFDLDPPTHDVF